MRTLSVLVAFALSCTHASSAPKRDWNAHPAVVVDKLAPSTVYAMSDVHCAYTRLVTLLERNALIASKPSSPREIAWSAGNSTFVVVGDLVDKGPECVEVVDALIALQASASKAGGRVVVTMGNHEAEFIADPFNNKTSKKNGFATALDLHGIKPQQVADGVDARGIGAWLRSLPIAAQIGSFVFVHAGFAKPTSIAQLSSSIANDVDANGFAALTTAESVLEVRDWATESSLASTLGKLDAKHVVVGHDPSSIGPKGTIAMLGDGLLFRVDTGMSPDIDYAQGALLRIKTAAGRVVVDVLDAKGNASMLWTGPE